MECQHDSEIIITAWIEDFWQAFIMRPKFIRWLIFKLMGRYARNELLGSKREMEKSRTWINNRNWYCLQDQDYHESLDKYKDW